MNITYFRYEDLQLNSALFTNPRKRTGLGGEELRELAAHIGRYGLEYPLRVTAAGTVTGGQRRYKAIGILLARTELDAFIESQADRVLFNQRATLLEERIPCIIDEETDPGILAGKALADNLLREPMASYDVAEQIVMLHERGDSNKKIADSIGRSPSYVSRMLSTWRNAIPELHVIWASGQMSYEQVREMAELTEQEQRASLMAPKPRGGHGRPGIDALKSLCARAISSSGVETDPYRRGIRDALRVATGDAPADLIDGAI